MTTAEMRNYYRLWILLAINLAEMKNVIKRKFHGVFDDVRWEETVKSIDCEKKKF